MNKTAIFDFLEHPVSLNVGEFYKQGSYVSTGGTLSWSRTRSNFETDPGNNFQDNYLF